MQEAASLNSETNRGRRGAGARTCAWLVTVTCALFVVLAPAKSWAASAPMCDPSAQSVEAPPTLWPYNGGSIQAVPSCPDVSLSQDTGLPERVSTMAPLSPREAPFTTSAGYLARPSVERVQIPTASTGPVPAGHYPSIYRPPRG